LIGFGDVLADEVYHPPQIIESNLSMAPLGLARSVNLPRS